MSYSPNSDLLRRTIDLNYANKKRASSMKWIAVNGLVLVVFAYDLWGKCAGYTSVLHYVELCVAGVAGANLLQHAAALARASRLRAAAAPPNQPRLLGLSADKLDSSFGDMSAAALDRSAAEDAAAAAEALSLSLSMSMSAGRSWRSTNSSPPRSPHSPPSPHSPHSPASPPSPLGRYERDEFIADRHSLANYLRHRADRSLIDTAEPGWGTAAGAAGAGAVAGSPPVYQLAAIETDKGSPEEGTGPGGAGGAGGGGAGGAAHAQLWRRLQLDPQRLTQFNLNLRLWLHVTILQRVVREMGAIDDALAAHGLSDARIGQVSTERLRKLCAGGLPALSALLPFLEPFADQSYVVQRYRELATGGCLSSYKWNGGGASWDESRPTDAELLLHAFAAYLDAQLPRDGTSAGGAFSARHVSAGPTPPPRSDRTLVLHRATRIPPHYVLVKGEETIEVGAGRNNLLHCLLVFIATCASSEPPALQRVHLGPAGLNMLWIVGR